MSFLQRLELAAAYAQVEWKQSAIAKSLGIDRRVVHQWFPPRESIPNLETMTLIARKWGVDAVWLATGSGDMVRVPDDSSLNQREREIIRYYRTATPKKKDALFVFVRALAKAMLLLCLAIPSITPKTAEAAVNIITCAVSQALDLNTHCVALMMRAYGILKALIFSQRNTTSDLAIL